MSFNRVEEFEKITKNMLDIYKKKNSNYGNSFGKAFEELGPISGITRLYDKMQRAISLVNGDNNNYESLEDTFIDMANYAIMNLIEMKYQKSKLSTKATELLKDSILPLEVDVDSKEVKVKVGDKECCCQLDS